MGKKVKHNAKIKQTTSQQQCCAKINEKNDKFYRKFAFPMYTEIVNFSPQS